MKKFILLLFILFSIHYSFSQFNLKLVVTEIATKNRDDIYVMGNFNNWDPKDPNYKLKPFAAGRKVIIIKDLEPGNYAYKFTRGSNDKLETEADGRDIKERMIDLNSDISIDCNIKGWKDNYPDKPKPYTASPQVKLIDSAFVIPQLNRTRKIWAYLPKGYSSSSKSYPVIYMQDGQNLFNVQTANNDEWGVDESMDSLLKITKKECIIIGIESSEENRQLEYAPYNFESNKKMVKVEGKLYADFLANTLKPFIDSKFRTKKSYEFNTLVGAGLGATISLYTLIQYPNVFGAAGIFSPIFDKSKELFVDAAILKNANPLKIYFYAGGKEDVLIKSDIHKMADIFGNKVEMSVFRTVTEIGQHKEKYWRYEFPNFYNWLMKD